ncbi:hypothetical protein N665_0083s0053 [Sinapis alba]|nr:hypothetical protein N665_0083s0053 [Sinapis alba]
MVISKVPVDLLEEILSRVQVKSMGAVRSIFKRWNTLCKYKSLIDKHISKVSREKEFMMITRDYRVYLINVCLYKSQDNKFGLSVKRKDIDNMLVVWNPYMCKSRWIKWPSGAYHDEFAFGYDKSSCGHFKILMSCYPHYNIYDARSNPNSWRVISSLPCADIPNFCEDNVSLKGVSYWYAKEKDSHGFLLRFNFTREWFGPHTKMFDDDDGDSQGPVEFEVDKEYLRKLKNNRKCDDLGRYEAVVKEGKTDEDKSEEEASDPEQEIGVDEVYEWIDSLVELWKPVQEDDYNKCEDLCEEKSSTKPTSQIITNQSLVAAQNEVSVRVMDLFTVKKSQARTLLIHYQWKVDKLHDVYDEKGKKGMFKTAALNVFDHHTSLSEFRYSLRKKMTCDNCWKEHFTVKINEGMSKRITCMAHKCNAICEKDVVKKLVYPKLAEKFDSFLVESYADNSKWVKWCPRTPHQGNAIRKEDDGGELEVECSCGHQLCFSCLCESHSCGQHSLCSCLMRKLLKKKCEDESETLNWITVHTRMCPKYRKYVHMNDGCNLRTCICGQHFCWLCGGATGVSHTCTTIEGHCCGKLKEHKVKRMERTKRDLERYTHYYHQCRSHTDSSKQEYKLREIVFEKVALVSENIKLNMVYNMKWASNGADLLFRARRILSYTYAFAFYMFGEELFKDEISDEEREMKKNLFENLQQQFIGYIERLPETLTQPFDDYSSDGDYFLKQMWKEKDGKSKTQVIDEAEIEQFEKDVNLAFDQEEFETQYCHEEKYAGKIVKGQSRIVEGSVRKKDSTRKTHRKKDKPKIAGFKGGEEFLLNARDMDDEYDKMMKAVFDHTYYGAEDSQLHSDEDDDDKPEFDKENELLTATREKVLKQKENAASDNDEEHDKRKRKRKRKTSLVKRVKRSLMEEYYKIDYDDSIGDLKTRLKFAKVQFNSYMLEKEEILFIDDIELNQYVPLKKMAAYVEKDWEVNKYKVEEQKLKFKMCSSLRGRMLKVSLK